MSLPAALLASFGRLPTGTAVVGVGATAISYSGSSLVVDMPAGVAAGDKLYGVFIADAAGSISCSGWTRILDGGSSGIQYYIFMKECAGTEGSTQTFSTHNTPFSGFIFGVEKQANLDPNIVRASSINPPSVTSDFGSLDGQLAVGIAISRDTGSPTPFLSGYPANLPDSHYASATEFNNMGLAAESFDGATFDPDAFTFDSAPSASLAFTFICPPVSATQLPAPVVESTNNGPDTVSGSKPSSISVNLPTGIASGDHVFVLAALDSATANPSATGWNRYSMGSRAFVFWKLCDGTEGSTVSVSLAVAAYCKFHSVRVSGAHPDTTLTTNSQSTNSQEGSGTGSGVNPGTQLVDALDTSQGRAYYGQNILVLTWLMLQDTGTSINVPSNTTDDSYTDSTTGTGKLGIGFGSATATDVTSFNVGAWSWTGSIAYAVSTFMLSANSSGGA